MLNANTDAHDLLIWIIDEVIAQRRAKAFMLESRQSESIKNYCALRSADLAPRPQGGLSPTSSLASDSMSMRLTMAATSILSRPSARLTASSQTEQMASTQISMFPLKITDLFVAQFWT